MTTLPCDAGCCGRRREPTAEATLTAAGLRRNTYVQEQSSARIRLDADHEWFAHRWSALTRTGGMVRKQSHLHIQDHRNKNNRTIESRSIGTLAFAANYDR